MIVKPGKFITVEGVEGVGKTTNMAFIQSWLERQGIDHIKTREPGGTPLAEDIRELLLSPRDEAVNENTELLLMFAARAQHLAEVIVPALERGQWVLCDRFTDATYAYQGGGRGVAMEKIALLENLVQEQLRPDITLILDAPVAQGLERANKRSQPDRFEQEKLDFFEQVRECYLSRAKKIPMQYRIVDASQSLAQVQLDLGEQLNQFMEASCNE
jgi:dTMP kinase